MSSLAYRETIGALWAIWAGYWLYHAWGNKQTAYRSNRVWRIVALFGLVALIDGLGRFPEFANRQLVPRTTANEVAGVLLCAAGVAFSIWARRILGKNWSANPTIKEGHELIQSGPYALVRHPIYTGILLGVFGMGLGHGEMRDLCVFLYFLIGFCLKLRVEESLMRRQFPDAYPEYRRRTKALIPFVL